MDSPRTDRLKPGTVTPVGIVLMVMATAAPLGAMATALPLVVGLGNGLGAPGTYLLVAVVLGLFAIGYAAMSVHVVNAGAFYAYIGAGLGRPTGVAAGLVAVLAYNVLTLYVVGLVGYFSEQTFRTELGVEAPWWVYSLLALGLAVGLGIRGLELNIRALGVVLAVETAILLVFDVVAVVRNGLAVLPADAFDPAVVLSGSPGVAVLFAVTCFLGFEATAIFAEEARDPHRTIPRATYLAVAVIGVLYTVTAWVVVGTNGGARAGEVAAADPGTYTFTAIASVLGPWSTDVANWLLLSSLVAVLISLHNLSSRYLFAFGREGVLPRALGRTHPRFGTPAAAGLVQVALMVLVAGGYALAGADPYLDLGSQTAGIGTAAVIALMATCSFAVPFFFARRGRLHPGRHVAAPVVAGLALALFAFLVLDNYALITGSTSVVVNGLPVLIPVVAAIGFVIGRRRPQQVPLDMSADEGPGDQHPRGATMGT